MRRPTSVATRSRRTHHEPDVPAYLLAPERPARVPAQRTAQPVQRTAQPVQPEPEVPVPARPRLEDYVPAPVPDFAAPPVAPRPEPRIAFRPDVEGLRGVAVLLVVLYHASLPWLPGGFVGVDAFFVVSGYVITSLLVAEVRDRGGVSLLGFYARRCRRILPAAGFVLVATCALGVVLLSPLGRLKLARDVLPTALYSGNWHFIAEQTDYLRAGADPSPVLHYWSLGVEEQFYLVWPFAFVAALWAARRFRVARTTALAVVLTALTAGSFALGLHWTASSAPLAYLSSPSRGWQFACGAWLALLLPVAARFRSLPARLAREAVGLVGAGALVWSALRIGDAGYPGTAALVPTLATAALLAAGADVPRTAGPLVCRVLGSRALRRLGGWSFTWYLWHWPLVVLAAARFGDLGWPVRLAVVVGALVPAVFTSRWIERPLRRSAVVARPRAGLALGLASTVLPVTAAVVVGVTALSGVTGQDVVPGAGSVDRAVVRFDDTLTSGPVVPSPGKAAQDLPAGLKGCLVAALDDTSPECLSGRPGPAGPIVLLGDSHAEQWMYAVRELADREDTAVLQLTHAGCSAAHVDVLQGDERLACNTWRESALRRIETGPRPAMVIVSSLSAYLRTAEEIDRAWRPTMRRLTALGVPVVYVVDTPRPARDVPSCVSGALQDWSRCAFPRSAAFRPDPVPREIAAGQWPGAHVVDLTVLLCPATSDACPAVRGGVLLYRDHSHLSGTAVRVLAPQFVAAVRAQLG